jgi:DNA polymerase-3 subunit delta'
LQVSGKNLFKESGEPEQLPEELTAHQAPDMNEDACDKCESCLKIASGSHPDVQLISPEERQIRIEEVRKIDEVLSYKPFEGIMKIVIVDDADTMNNAAANAFLKTLEEPPKESIIILISSRPDRLPSTIRSRCSRINFRTLSSESCIKLLKGKIPEEDLEYVTRLSMGRPGIALSTDIKKDRESFLKLLEDMMNAEKDSWSSREEIEQWFEFLLTLLRDIAVLKISGTPSQLINEDLMEYLLNLGKSADLKVIIEMYKELNLLKGLLFFNLNKSITWNYTSSLLRKGLLN